KSEKTKSRCAKAIKFLLNDTFLIKRMRKTHTLPIKNIEINSDVPRKVLERHRKYIIAAVEIISGDYPCLAEYLRYIQ
ncbi:MAG: RNA polymerase subunit sigma, partial [Oscillospiraceae bacterium]